MPMADGGEVNVKPRLMETLIQVRKKLARLTPHQVPAECLDQKRVLASLSSPEWNFQPCCWIIVQSDPGKRQLQSATYLNVPLASAPVVLICLADTLAWKTAPQRLREMVAKGHMSEEEAREILRRIREHYSASPETALRAALANAVFALHQNALAAADGDVSAYWVSEFDEQKIKTYFNIPDQFLVAALLALGHQGETLPPAPDLPVQFRVYQEKFGEPLAQE